MQISHTQLHRTLEGRFKRPAYANLTKDVLHDLKIQQKKIP